MTDGNSAPTEYAICGAADHHMALALVGKAHVSLPGNIHPNYIKPFMIGMGDAAQFGNLGFLPFTIEHAWYGSKDQRRYIDRWSILDDARL